MFYLELIIVYYYTHSTVSSLIFQRLYNFFFSGLRSDKDTVRFVFRMALHNYSRIRNNVRLVFYRVGLSVNQIQYILPAAVHEYLQADWCYRCKEEDMYKLVLK